MKPRSFERGKKDVADDQEAIRDASMKPRSFERGKAIAD